MKSGHDVIVVGGGFGGLLVACEVARRGGRPLLLEAGPTAGGVAATIKDDGYLLEPAAGSMLLPHAALTPILEAADASVVPAESAARRRFVYDRGTLFEFAGPRAITTGLVSNRAKLRLLRERWVRAGAGNSDESLVVFLQRRFGTEAGRLGATLMAHGVFAGDPERLSARAAFPALVALEDEMGSMMRGGLAKRRARQQSESRSRVHVATNGMASLAGELASYLGDAFQSGWPVDSIRMSGESWVAEGAGQERAPVVVVALAPAAAARLVPEPLVALLGEAAAAPVVVVGLGGSSADLPLPRGFGALVGPDTDVRALGLLFESSYAPGRASHRRRLLKCIYGGAADPEAFELDDEQLLELAIEESGRVVGVTLQPTWTRVIRHAPGIPQYNLGHMAWLGRLDEAVAEFRGLHLAGWGYRGIGLTALAQDATVLADRIVGAARLPNRV